MYKKCIVESNAKIGTLELFVRCSSQHTIQCVGATSQSLVELVMSKQLVNQPRDPKYVRDSVYIEEQGLHGKLIDLKLFWSSESTNVQRGYVGILLYNSDFIDCGIKFYLPQQISQVIFSYLNHNLCAKRTIDVACVY